MKTLTQNQLQSHLGEFLDQAATGERITVTRNNKPVATLGPSAPSSILDLEPVSVGKIYRPLTSDDDMLDEMIFA